MVKLWAVYVQAINPLIRLERFLISHSLHFLALCGYQI